MSDFDNEWETGISKEETSTNYINEPGVSLVTIKGFKLSPKDHTGVPYIEFTFETLGDEKGMNKAIGMTRLYRVQESDNEQKRSIKQKKIKELMANAGADMSKKGTEVLQDSIGKTINALFKQSEYIGFIKDENNKPVIRTKVDYSFSAPKNKQIEGSRKYLYGTLNESKMKEFEGKLKLWGRDNGVDVNSQQNSAPTQEEYQNQGAGESPAINPEDDDDADF